MQTPFGLNITKDVGLFMSHFIANYKGGRNESYMYGYDKNTKWFDYDVTSAYTTAMALLGNPLYKRTKILFRKNDIDSFTKNVEELLYNYVLIKTSFKFPKTVKYPSIPCYLKSGKATVYPLKGDCILTGPEYLVAKNQGCVFNIKYLIIIPCSKVLDEDTKEVTYINKPFYSVVKNLQGVRGLYKKGTILNLLYKEIYNSIYGNVVKGISNKKLFDVKSGRTLPVNANALANPILGCYITGYIRSLLGECMHNISLLNGKIVSSTTDGFITDIDDLENKLLKLPEKHTILLNLFRDIRSELSDKPGSSTLEIKSEGLGIIS